MTGTIRGLCVVNQDVIWISGAKGEFSLTINGGKNWFHQVVAGAEKHDFRDVHGFSASTALLMSIGPGQMSKVFRTENGGESWQITYENQDSMAFFDGMDFFNENEGLIISDPVDLKPYLLKTRDGGITWVRLIPENIPDVLPGEYVFAASGTSLDAASDGQCWLATGGSAARVFYSDDRGRNWIVAPTPVLYGDPASGIFSISRGSGSSLAVAGGHYQRIDMMGSNIGLSTDYGKTWSIPAGAVHVPFIECIRFLDEKTLIAAGPPGVWLSQDSGQNWHKISKEGFHAMDVVEDECVAWLAGDKGKVVIFKLGVGHKGRRQKADGKNQKEETRFKKHVGTQSGYDRIKY